MRSSPLLALFLLFSSVAFAREYSPKINVHSKSRNYHEGIELVLHNPVPDTNPSLSTILDHDNSRVHSLTARIFKKPSTVSTERSRNTDISTPLSPGASFGVGNYVTTIKLGTPSKSYAMVVDTGSSLTWLQCSPCNVSCHDQVGAIFDPSASKSYSAISCSATECSSLTAATLNPSGCSHDVCQYEASYGDSSFSVGYLSKETLSLGTLSIPNFIYGCGQDNEGLFGRSAGLMGLAKNELSFLAQVSKKAGAYAFSYCLPTASGSSGKLSLGPYSDANYSFTPMLKSSLDDTLYFIKLKSINLDSKPLHVSASSYDAPTIIDSGTVITRIPSDIYTALKEAVTEAMKKRKYRSGPAYSILDACFVGSTKNVVLPEVSMVFEGGAEVKLPVKNVMIDVDVETTCLAFAEAGSVAIIGNRQQQTFNVVYDVGKERIGFAADGCV